MLSHMWTLSLTASLLFALLKFSGLGPLLRIEWIVLLVDWLPGLS